MSVWENLIGEVGMYEYCMYTRQSRSYCSFDVVITLDSTVTTSYPPTNPHLLSQALQNYVTID